MRSRFLSFLSLVIIVAVLAGCGLPTGSEAAQLAFGAQMNVDFGQRIHVSLGVRNVGQERFRAYEDFGGVMELRNANGVEVGRISMATLGTGARQRRLAGSLR